MCLMLYVYSLLKVILSSYLCISGSYLDRICIFIVSIWSVLCVCLGQNLIKSTKNLSLLKFWHGQITSFISIARMGVRYPSIFDTGKVGFAL